MAVAHDTRKLRTHASVTRKGRGLEAVDDGAADHLHQLLGELLNSGSYNEFPVYVS